MKRAGWFLGDVMFVFLELEEWRGTDDGESIAVSGVGRIRLAAEFSIRVISYGGVTVAADVGKGSTPWRTDVSEGES